MAAARLALVRLRATGSLDELDSSELSERFTRRATRGGGFDDFFDFPELFFLLLTGGRATRFPFADISNEDSEPLPDDPSESELSLLEEKNTCLNVRNSVQKAMNLTWHGVSFVYFERVLSVAPNPSPQGQQQVVRVLTATPRTPDSVNIGVFFPALLDFINGCSLPLAVRTWTQQTVRIAFPLRAR